MMHILNNSTAVFRAWRRLHTDRYSSMTCQFVAHHAEADQYTADQVERREDDASARFELTN